MNEKFSADVAELLERYLNTGRISISEVTDTLGYYVIELKILNRRIEVEDMRAIAALRRMGRLA